MKGGCACERMLGVCFRGFARCACVSEDAKSLRVLEDGGVRVRGGAVLVSAGVTLKVSVSCACVNVNVRM